MRPHTPVAASLAALAALVFPHAASAAIQVFDLGPPISAEPGGFEGRRIGPDGTVAGRAGTTLASGGRPAIWRDGTLAELASPPGASASDAGDAGAVGPGSAAAFWRAPSFGRTTVTPPFVAPRVPGSGVSDAWLTASGRVVQIRGEGLEDGNLAVSWIDGVQLAATPQTAISQDAVLVTDVAESGWIVGTYEHLEWRTIGAQPAWYEVVSGYAVWDDGAHVRTFPTTASPSTDFQPRLVDEVGTLYGRRGGALGRMRAGSDAFEAIASPPGTTFVDVKAVAGDGVIVGTTVGDDSIGNTADDEAWLKRGDGAWARIRDRIPAPSTARALGLDAYDVNTSGDVLLRTFPGQRWFVLRSRSRIAGTVATPALPGAALAAARVEVVATGLAGAPTVRATVGSDGRYALVVPPGRYRLALVGGAGCSVGTGGCTATRELALDGARDVTLAFRVDAATKPAVPVVRPGAKLAARRGSVGVRVACRLVTRRCTGTLALLPARGSRALATRKLDLAPGATATVRVTLPAAVRRRIAGRATLAVRIRATTKVAGGRSVATIARARLD